MLTGYFVESEDRRSLEIPTDDLEDDLEDDPDEFEDTSVSKKTNLPSLPMQAKNKTNERFIINLVNIYPKIHYRRE